jgi:hypothetical protein
MEKELPMLAGKSIHNGKMYPYDLGVAISRVVASFEAGIIGHNSIWSTSQHILTENCLGRRKRENLLRYGQ